MEKFRKVLNSIFGVLLIIPNLLVVIGVVDAGSVPGLTEGLADIQSALITIAEAVAGIILLFTGAEPLSAKNLY